MASKNQSWRWTALFLSLIAFASAILFAFGLAGSSSSRKNVSPPKQDKVSATNAAASPFSSLPIPNAEQIPATSDSHNTLSENTIDDSRREQILNHLQEVAITYDASNLPKIQPYLTSQDKEVREAAVNAVVTLGEGVGAELLRQAASQLKDPREKVAFLDAAEYVELPSGSLIQPGDRISNVPYTTLRSSPKPPPPRQLDPSLPRPSTKSKASPQSSFRPPMAQPNQP